MKALLNVELFGKPENPPLVMLHGFMGRASSFASMMDALAGKFYVAAFDLPGHGLSRFSSLEKSVRPKTFFDAAVMVLKGLDALEIGRFSLFGYSMGGRLAQAVYLNAPQRVERLILESASFGIADAAEREKRHRQDLELLSRVHSPGELEDFLVRWHRSPLFSTLTGTPVLDALTAEKLDNDPCELRKSLAVLSIGNHQYFLPALADLSAPADFLYGEDDEKYKNEALSAVKIMKRMSLHPFHGASHDVHSQYPDKVAKTIINLARPQG